MRAIGARKLQKREKEVTNESYWRLKIAKTKIQATHGATIWNNSVKRKLDI
jgi:hypothetical protein